jgi:uncharacterized SAM-binding protein YcdF (DUF218 family)
MFRLVRWIVRSVAMLVLLVLGFYFGGSYAFTALGQYLITQHPLAKADLILVLSDQPYLGVPEGARVYHDGFAPKILLTRGPKERGAAELLRLGIRIPDAQETALKILEALRVPRKDILTIDEPPDGAREAMEEMARFLKKHSARVLIVVASKSHTTRLHKIFSASLGPEFRLIMHPVPGDPFDPSRWWHDRNDRRHVLYEYQALADFWREHVWQAVIREARKSVVSSGQD